MSSFNNLESIQVYSAPGVYTPRRGPKTLVLDIDKTLLHSWESQLAFLDTYQIYSDPKIHRLFHPIGSHPRAYSMFLKMEDGSTNRIWGLFRPHLFPFLAFAESYFENIVVWSAGLKPYVEEITKQMFSRAPKLVWSRNKCSHYQGIFHKPIHDINTDLCTRPYLTFRIDPVSTLVLDDNAYTFLSNPTNGVLIPIYHPGKDKKVPSLEDLLDTSDRALLQFQEWLQRPEVKNSMDVRTLDKSHIFS